MLRSDERDPTAALSPGTRWYRNSPRRRLTNVMFINLTLAGKTEWLLSPRSVSKVQHDAIADSTVLP